MMTLNSNYILLNDFIIVTKFWVILYSCYCFISLVAQIFGRELLLESQETNEDTVSRGNNFVRNELNVIFLANCCTLIFTTHFAIFFTSLDG